MWNVEEHRRVEKQLDAVPKDILKRYEKWLDIATISHPPGLRTIKGFRDEALSGVERTPFISFVDSVSGHIPRCGSRAAISSRLSRRTIIGGRK